MAAERYRVPEGTLPLLAGVLYSLDAMHANMVAMLQDLPPDAVSWKPGDEMGSLGGIVRHTCYCEEYAIRAAAGEDAPYDRRTNAAQWEATDDAAALIAAIRECDAMAKRLLPPMTVADLGRELAIWGGPERASAGILLADALSHSSMHWGHLQMTRQLWERAHPEFVGTYTRW